MIVPARLVVMGVSGVGKSTVGRALSERLGVDFAEGDDFHSAASVARMAAGIALTDDDRAPWLERIGRWLGERQEGGVASCSSLRRAYRDRIRRLCPDVAFVHLAAGASLVRERVASRSGHYMPASLVDSQFEALEELAPDEVGIRLDASEEPAQLVERASAFAQRLGSSSMRSPS